MGKLLLEIVGSTADDCVTAERGGADRIELCSAIMTGGLTPSLGTLIEATRLVRIPIVVMVRPRAGGFCYSEAEFATMQRDISLMVEHGAHGVVFGALHANSTLDIERCRTLVALAKGRETVFHRAFDAVRDPYQTLDELIELGFTRVLTSGQRHTAQEGLQIIKDLVDHAAGRIQILPAGAVRAHNVQHVVAITGCRQVHLTAFSAKIDASVSTAPLEFGSIPNAPSSAYERTDVEFVAHVREALDAISV